MTTVNANTFTGPNNNTNYQPGTIIASAPMNTDLVRIKDDLNHHKALFDVIFGDPKSFDTMEAGATADQTAAEIVALINGSSEVINPVNLDITSTVNGLIGTGISTHRGTAVWNDMHALINIRDADTASYSTTPIALVTNPTTLLDEVNNIRRMFDIVIGKNTWVDSPTKNLEQLSALFDGNGDASPQAHASEHITGGSDTIANAQASGSSGLMSGADKAKLDGIETGATADQTASEIRSLVASATDSNVLTDALKTKLDSIESGATADQTAAEIRTLVSSATDSNVFTDAFKTKLTAIEAGATATQHFNYVEKTTNYTATLTDYVILCNAVGGAITITLPAASTATKQMYQIKKIDQSANSVTIDANGTELIDTNQTFDLVVENESLTVYCNGTKWVIV